MQFRYKFPRAVLAVAVSFACVQAHAQQQGDATDLDQVVVTATRTEQSRSQTLAPVTVIDRADIERLQPSSLPDLLRGTPGVSLANNGGPGKATSLFLRGTDSDHVLVLVDGIRIGSATSGGASLQDIPVEQIERIEIVRGPYSSLYGSEAIGGVIQVFTRRPQGAFAPHASASVGSFATRRASAGAAGKGERGWYSVNLAHEDTDGINASRNKSGFDPDKDGYRNNSATVQGGYEINPQWSAEARLFRAEGYNEYDGSLNNQSDIVQQVLGGRVYYTPSERLKFTASVGSSADLSENFLNGVFSSNFDTRRELGSLQADIGAGSGLLSLGYDWLRDEVQSNTVYALDQRVNRGLFGQWQQELGAHALQASVRRDDNDQFGGQTTGSAQWGWNFTKALRLGASYGTAFKAPTFNELYYPGYGNPELQPENSRSLELSLRGEHGWGEWSLNAYETRIDDMIAHDSTLGEFGGPNNIDRAVIQGLEATVGVRLADWDLHASATWLDPRNDGDNASNGNILPRRARRTARIDADRQFGDFSFGASVIGAGERYDNLANTTRLGGHGLTDLRIGYDFNAAWSLQLAANNVFDKRYETAALYNQPGRNYLLTLRFRPAN